MGLMEQYSPMDSQGVVKHIQWRAPQRHLKIEESYQEQSTIFLRESSKTKKGTTLSLFLIWKYTITKAMTFYIKLMKIKKDYWKTCQKFRLFSKTMDWYWKTFLPWRLKQRMRCYNTSLPEIPTELYVKHP